MEGTAKRQVNAEEMLAELKRVVESSTRAPQAPPLSAPTPPKPSTPRPKAGRSHWGINPPDEAIADKSIRPRTDLQRPTRPRSRSWTPIAGGIALAAAAAIGVSSALINKAPNLPEREPSVTSAAGPVSSQNEPALKPSSDSPSLMGVARHAEALGALEAPPHAGETSASSAAIPVPEKAALGAPNLASFGLDAAPTFRVPPSSPAVPVPTQRIGPDGAPVATGSGAPPAQAPKPAASAAASQAVPDRPPVATAPAAPVATDSTASPSQPSKPAAPAAASQAISPDKPSVATAPATTGSTNPAHPTETPKPNPTQTTSTSEEPAERSAPKIDLKKTPPERPALQKPHKTAKASAKPVAEAERHSTEPAPRKEAEKSAEPPQAASSPTTIAPAKAPSVQQRVADGVGHAFGYLVHLPGALVPHLGGSNANPQ